MSFYGGVNVSISFGGFYAKYDPPRQRSKDAKALKFGHL